MRRCTALLLAVSISWGVARGQAPVLELPRGWAAVVSVRRPAEVAQKATAVLDELSVEWAPLKLFEALDVESLSLDRGDFHFGLVAPRGDLDLAYFIAIVPTEPAAIAAATGGEMAGDVALLTIDKTEFIAARRKEATIVFPADQDGLLEREFQRTPPPLGDLSLKVSKLGLSLLKRKGAGGDRNAQRSRRGQLRELGWPPSRQWLHAALTANEPLVARLNEVFSAIAVDVFHDEQKGTTAQLTGELRDAPTTPGGNLNHPAPRLPEVARPPIARLYGDASDGALLTAARLMLAYSHGRPDEVDAHHYPDVAYREIEKHVLRAVGRVESADVVVLSRLADDPYQSNRVALLRVKEPSAFLNDLKESVRLWNKMLKVIHAGTMLTIDADENQLLGPDAPPATRFTTNVARALDPEGLTLEIQEIANRYYGNEGKHVLHLAPLGGGLVLVGDAIEEELREIAAKRTTGKPDSLSGECRVDRYAQWQNAMLADYLKDAIGFKPPRRVEPAPLGFELKQAGERFEVRASLPRKAVLALGRHLLERRKQWVEEP